MITPYRSWLMENGMIPLQPDWNPSASHLVFVSWAEATGYPSGVRGLIEAVGIHCDAPLAWTQVTRKTDYHIAGLLFVFEEEEQAETFKRVLARELVAARKPVPVSADSALKKWFGSLLPKTK